MIVFHEGLPGSGKSYEACAMHILPALDKGRRVVTNIEGINHAKFAELLHIPELDLKDRLICVFDHDIEIQKENFLRESGKDALIIIDEIQNLFPSERQKLPPEWNRYVSEHRHDGLDIVLMGQDRRDCHSMWRRRIQRVITFNKLSAVGQDNRYRWQCLEATRPEKYKAVTSGVRSYDSKYFGLYASHTQGTDNKNVYSDDRANVLKNKNLKLVLFVIPVLIYFAVSTLYDFFNPDAPQIVKTEKLPEPEKGQFISLSEPTADSLNTAPMVEVEPPPIDIFDQYAKQYRLRLSALVIASEALRDMGWSVSYRDSGLYITKQGITHIARAWPIDKFGRVDNDTLATL